MAKRNYTVLATSTNDDKYTSSEGKYKVLAEGDDVQSTKLDTPKSNFDFTNPDDYGRAFEGMGIASGVTEDIQGKRNPYTGKQITRTENIYGEMGEGASNLYDGTLQGMNQMASDVAGLIGLDSVSDLYSALAQKRGQSIRNRNGDDNSAAGAVGNELGGMAVTAPIGGKAVDLLFGGGKALSKPLISGYKKLKYNRGANNYTDVVTKAANAQTAEREVARKLGLSPSEAAKLDKFTPEKASIEPMILSMLPSDLKSKVTGIADEILQWVPYLGRKASAREFSATVDRLVGKHGLSRDDAVELAEELMDSRFKASVANIKPTAVDSVLKSPNRSGSSVGALLGTQDINSTTGR